MEEVWVGGVRKWGLVRGVERVQAGALVDKGLIFRLSEQGLEEMELGGAVGRRYEGLVR